MEPAGLLSGATKLTQLEENLRVVAVTFTPEELQQLNAVSQLASEYSGWILVYSGQDRVA